MNCPQCKSENVIPSRSRGMERVLRYIYPRSPYRCRECWNRFWAFKNPFQSLSSKITAGAIALFMLVPPIMVQVQKHFHDESSPVIRMKIANPFDQSAESSRPRSSTAQSVSIPEVAQKSAPKVVASSEPLPTEVITDIRPHRPEDDRKKTDSLPQPAPVSPLDTPKPQSSSPASEPAPASPAIADNMPAAEIKQEKQETAPSIAKAASPTTEESLPAPVAPEPPPPAPIKTTPAPKKDLTEPIVAKQTDDGARKTHSIKEKPEADNTPTQPLPKSKREHVIIRDIQAMVSNDECRIVIVSNGIPNYKFFDPKNDKCPYPQRAIDLEGVKMAVSTFGVENDFIAKTRVATPDRSVLKVNTPSSVKRITFDLKVKIVSSQVQETKDGLVITLKK